MNESKHMGVTYSFDGRISCIYGISMLVRYYFDKHFIG